MHRNSCLQVAVAVMLAGPAFGQSLIAPERTDEARQFFASAATAPVLRCEVAPMRPSLNFAFRLQVVYTIDVPLFQFRGKGHHLTTVARITPEGRAPMYLSKTETMPEVPDTKSDGETVGAFVVGEGAYKAEILLEDDMHRICRAEWQIQARRNGSEQKLKTITPPGTVEELSLDGPPPDDTPSGPSAAKITILLQAAPLMPTGAGLQADDVQRSVDTIASLKREFPARSMSVIVFNLEQHAVLFRQDDFDASQAHDLTQALAKVNLAVVDYNLMRDQPPPVAMLTGLIQTELQAPQPPDAVILIGPRTRLQADVPLDPLGTSSAGKHVASVPIFNLQFQAPRQFQPMTPPIGGPPRRRKPPTGDGEVVPNLMPGMVDTVERLVSRIKGQTIVIRNPHDLADAIQRMDSRIAKAIPPPRNLAPQPTVGGPLAEPGDGEDPVDILMRLRDRVSDQANRIPNHTCVETIRREIFLPVAGRAPKSCDALLAAARQRSAEQRLKLDSADRLRLDVAYSPAGREVFSWAGANKFEDVELNELVTEGAIGTGAFAATLLSAFENRGTKYAFEGVNVTDQRRLFEYSFAVSEEQSHYKVKAQQEWILTGYTGVILVDPKTTDLVRLTVRTEQLPAATNTCESTTSFEYGLVQLNANDYLLPKLARQRFIGRDGFEVENAMSFSACRDFQAESKLDFGTGAPSVEKHPAAATPSLDLPRGLPVTVELTAAISFDEAAAGDRIAGRLTAPVRDERGKVLLAAGARLQGRLMRVETRYAPRKQYTLALRWETVEAGGAPVPISLVPNRPGPKETRVRGEGRVLRTRVTGFELPLPGETRYGIYDFPGETTTVESGFPSEWFTAKP